MRKSVDVIYCAWLIYSLDKESRSNRLAVVFNITFALWAAAASFWYGTGDPKVALTLYKAFSWTWYAFSPLMLHFTLRITRSRFIEGRRGALVLFCLYAPGAALCVLSPAFVITDPVYRCGYWMLAVKPNVIYLAIVVYYVHNVIMSIVVIFSAAARTSDRREFKRYRLLGRSFVVSGFLGLFTDVLCLVLGLDVPNLAIFWILIISVSMFVAMSRYGFLAKLPARDAFAVLEGLSECVLYIDDSGRLLWCNSSAVAAVGARSFDQARQLSCQDFLPAEIAGLVGGMTSPAAEGDDERKGVRTSLGPEAIPVKLWMHRVDEGVVLTAVDLRGEQSRRNTEKRLADTDLLLDEFIARSMDGILLTDCDGRVVRWNEPMATLSGVGPEEALGAFCWDVRALTAGPGSGEPERSRKLMHLLFTDKKSALPRHSREVEIYRRDGESRIVQGDVFAIPLADGPIIALIAHDVTDERRLSEETIRHIRKLDHSQKMEAVGTLSGGIAHDFNNTLAGIVGAASLMRQELGSAEPTSTEELSKVLDIIERSAYRAASSVKRLLTLTRKQAPESAAFRLDESMLRVKEFAERSIDHTVSISAPPDFPEAWCVGDAGQVEQLILNLIINAEHAMTVMRPNGVGRGGTIHLGISAFRPDKRFLFSNPGVVDADYWAVSVRDEGVGIPHHIQNKIFDPFFTTKARESSSGLGLAMVHAITRQHGGFVDLVSEPGAGAELLVYLPASSSAESVTEREAAVRRGSGMILVADDDDIPRETAAAILESLGYTVVAAKGGDDALRMFAERLDEWKMAILDLRMGDADGDDIARRMRQSRPGIPVVLASGLHSGKDLSDYGLAGSAAILRKPYTISEMSRAVELALDRH